MLTKRIIPTLLLREQSLVKTVQFNKFSYVGDPVNTVKIFNELEVDELVFLDISASINNRKPNFDLLGEIADECFMPLSYGGGIKDLDQAKRIFDIGFEKVILNTASINNSDLVTNLANIYGSQAVIGSVDYKNNFWGKRNVYTLSGKKKTNLDVIEWCKRLESLGAGEILLTSIDKEGTWSGLDTECIDEVSRSVEIPVIAHGGAGEINHINEIRDKTAASAIGLGSMVVFQKKDMGVLINLPKHIA